MRCETSRDVALDEAVDDHADLRPFLIAIALVAMGLVIGACILGASSSAVSLGGVPLFGGVGLVVGVALAIFVFVKIRPYLK